MDDIIRRLIEQLPAESGSLIEGQVGAGRVGPNIGDNSPIDLGTRKKGIVGTGNSTLDHLTQKPVTTMQIAPKPPAEPDKKK